MQATLGQALVVECALWQLECITTDELRQRQEMGYRLTAIINLVVPLAGGLQL